MESHTSRLRESTALVCTLLGEEHSEATGADPGTVALDQPTEARAGSLVETVHALSDADAENLLSYGSRGRAELDRIIAVAAAEVAKRSERALGHSGLAQRRGHRNAVQLIQSITGESRGEATRQVKIGELLGEVEAVERAVLTEAPDTAELGSTPEVPREGGAPTDLDHPLDLERNGIDRDGGDSNDEASDARETGRSARLPWQHPVTDAINRGGISTEAGNVIVRTLSGVSSSCPEDAKRSGAAELVACAPGMSMEELASAARRLRDRIDVDGIEERFAERYDKRSLKTWHDRDGALNMRVVCDDESGVLITQVLDLALSPRRGGPRFTHNDDKGWAEQLLADPRTNEQLAFDVVLDVLRCGAACDESTVFRADRPAVCVVTVLEQAGIDGEDSQDGTDARYIAGELEGSDVAVPSSFVAAAVCADGVAPVTVDARGCALNLGRARRLFSAAQKVVLRARDGGCLWPRCDRPVWQTEAHHIRPWSKGGKTDVADGVLLCKFHHLNLHNYGWRIDRRGAEYFLVPPPGRDSAQASMRLQSKSSTWRQVLPRAS